MKWPFVREHHISFVMYDYFFQNSEAALISRYEPYMSSMKSIVKTVIENLADGTVGYSNPYVTDDPKIYIGM